MPQYSIHSSSMYSVLRKTFKNCALKGILGLIGDSLNESAENRRRECAELCVNCDASLLGYF